MNKSSFTAADSLPVKLLQQTEVYESIKDHAQIPMLHPQLILTNKCNLKCTFCSCAKDDRTTEMPFATVKRLIDTFKDVGAKAVTITGGGEPLLYPYFEIVVDMLVANGIEVGLVTNGILLPYVKPGTLNSITWIRISHDSSREFSLDYQEKLSKIVYSTLEVDWSFSYVVTKTTTAFQIKPIIDFANSHAFTHVRLVADLFNPSCIDLVRIQKKLGRYVDDSLVIYQSRNEPERGAEKCLIGLVKPLISADGLVYACCGVQYALEQPSKTLPKELCLGKVEDLNEIKAWGIANPINGEICAKCYYGQYNRVLSALVSQVKHRNFI